MNLPGVIRRTERALVEAERARNALGRIGTPHRALMVQLEAVVAALEADLARLRYAARREAA
jgi:hypothetical protein